VGAKADRQVVGIHQADGDCQVGKLLLSERGAALGIGLIGHMRVTDPGDHLGPLQRRLFLIAEQGSGLIPSRDEQQLLDRYVGLEQVAAVHVDAVRASVDLRDAKIDKINQRCW
jgi:hypothetical protein